MLCPGHVASVNFFRIFAALLAEMDRLQAASIVQVLS